RAPRATHPRRFRRRVSPCTYRTCPWHIRTAAPPAREGPRTRSSPPARRRTGMPGFLRSAEYACCGMRSKRDVGSEPELARPHAHMAARELGSVTVELHRVDQPRDAVKLRGTAIQRGTEHLQRRHHLGLAAIDLDRVDRRVACERRMVAVVPRQLGEERLHARLVVVEPDHLLADLRAVRGHLVPESRIAEIEESLEIEIVECEARPVHQLLDLVALLHGLAHATARAGWRFSPNGSWEARCMRRLHSA